MSKKKAVRFLQHALFYMYTVYLVEVPYDRADADGVALATILLNAHIGAVRAEYGCRLVA